MSKHIQTGITGIIILLLSACATDNRQAIEDEISAFEQQELARLQAREEKRQRELSTGTGEPPELSDEEQQEAEREMQYRRALNRASTDGFFGDESTDVMASVAPPQPRELIDEEPWPEVDHSAPTAPESESTLEKLPQQIIVEKQVDWLTLTVEHPVTGNTECAVVSEMRSIDDHTPTADIRILVLSDGVYLKSSEPLDQENPELGLRIDLGLPYAFDEHPNKNVSAITAQLEPTITAIQDGEYMLLNIALEAPGQNILIHIIEYELSSLQKLLANHIGC